MICVLHNKTYIFPRIVCKTNPEATSSFEQALFPIFQGILQQDIPGKVFVIAHVTNCSCRRINIRVLLFSEFIPYVFQILALLLELRHTQDIPEPYMALFPCLLSPVLFERQANIHPLIRLLQAFISHGSRQIAAQDKTSALLGVFQKLIASKANDHEGFLLIQSIIEHFDP